MSQDQHRRVKELFLEACALPDPERRAFIDRLSGDDAKLQQELLQLLDFHQAETSDTGARALSMQKEAERFRTGDVFVGRYRMLGMLGRGGMGEVYKAQDLILDQVVALKFLRYRGLPLMTPPLDPRASGPFQAGSPQLERLLNEVKLARQVTHPHVCRVFDFGQAEDELFLTMEYIDGEDLASLLARIGRFPQDKLIDLTLQLCEGLEAAHSQGILHRDLKPANVMIDGKGKVRITDFGLAEYRLPGKAEGASEGLAGTPAYMAPEQLNGEPASVQSDLYALGLILYEMATGRPAFTASSIAEYASLHDSQPPKPPSEHLSHFDPILEMIILRCLEKDPARRPRSAAQIAAALPGSARLDLVLAAGDTPSPELVAQAGSRRGLNSNSALWLFIALLIGLFAFAGLSDLAFPGRQAWAEPSPTVRAAKAREILQTLGHDRPIQDRSWGFLYQEPSVLDEASGLFWYRQAENWMVPIDIGLVKHDARVTFHDPPPFAPGMAQVVTTTEGNLVFLQIVLPDLEFEEPDGEASLGALDDSAPSVDWSVVLALANLEESELVRLEADFTPPIFVDQRIAWTTVDGALDISAGSHRGKVVFFDAMPTEEPPPEVAFTDQLQDFYFLLNELLWGLLVVISLVLAWRNWKRGRGDLVGARRLGLFVFGISSVHWLVIAHHVPELTSELDRLLPSLGMAVSEGVGAFAAYVGLEPLVRRYWPQTLISWSRLLHREAHDPLVGQSLLIGAFCGTVIAVLTTADRLLARALELRIGIEILDLWQLENATNTRMLIGNVLISANEAILWGVLGLLALVVCRVLLRGFWPGVIAFVLLSALIDTFSGVHPAISWLTLGLSTSVLTAWLLVRWGLLSSIVSLTTSYVLITSPVSFAGQAWYAESGALASLIIAGVGLYGLQTARRKTGSLNMSRSSAVWN